MKTKLFALLFILIILPSVSALSVACIEQFDNPYVFAVVGNVYSYFSTEEGCNCWDAPNLTDCCAGTDLEGNDCCYTPSDTSEFSSWNTVRSVSIFSGDFWDSRERYSPGVYTPLIDTRGIGSVLRRDRGAGGNADHRLLRIVHNGEIVPSEDYDLQAHPSNVARASDVALRPVIAVTSDAKIIILIANDTIARIASYLTNPVEMQRDLGYEPKVVNAYLMDGGSVIAYNSRIYGCENLRCINTEVDCEGDCPQEETDGCYEANPGGTPKYYVVVTDEDMTYSNPEYSYEDGTPMRISSRIFLPPEGSIADRFSGDIQNNLEANTDEVVNEIKTHFDYDNLNMDDVKAAAENETSLYVIHPLSPNTYNEFIVWSQKVLIAPDETYLTIYYVEDRVNGYHIALAYNHLLSGVGLSYFDNQFWNINGKWRIFDMKGHDESVPVYVSKGSIPAPVVNGSYISGEFVTGAYYDNEWWQASISDNRGRFRTTNPLSSADVELLGYEHEWLAHYLVGSAISIVEQQSEILGTSRPTDMMEAARQISAHPNFKTRDKRESKN